MTEAGEKWANELGPRKGFLTSKAHAEFWLRAFCEEVEKRANESYLQGVMIEGRKLDAFENFRRVFVELKRELLG